MIDTLPTFEQLIRVANHAGSGSCSHPMYQHERQHMELADALWEATSARAVLDSVERILARGDDPLEFLRSRVNGHLQTAKLKGWDGRRS